MSVSNLDLNMLAKFLIVSILWGLSFSFRLHSVQTRFKSTQAVRVGNVINSMKPAVQRYQFSVLDDNLSRKLGTSASLRRGTDLVHHLKSTKSNPAAQWTAAMDKRLMKEMQTIPRKPWKDIASCIGHGIKVHQCAYRWDTHLKLKNIAKDNDEPWTDEEYTLLTQLVADTATKNKRIDWQAIGAKLNRVPLSCRIKWDTELFPPQGYFSPDEDQLILETAQQASQADQPTNADTKSVEDKGLNKEVVKDRGVWARLGRQLGRSDHIVRARYLALICGFKTRVQWTDEMDNALTQLMESYNHTTSELIDWGIVTAKMRDLGFQLKGKECCNRWHVYLKYIHQGMRSCVEWTPQEVKTLMNMRTERNSWNDIGAALNVVPSVCCRKWHLVHDEQLKRGPFTPEEDECIRAHVKEWGDPKQKQGLWQKLKEVLNRPSIYIRQRWYNTLFHKEL